jgi:hypothetical protein
MTNESLHLFLAKEAAPWVQPEEIGVACRVLAETVTMEQVVCLRLRDHPHGRTGSS